MDPCIQDKKLSLQFRNKKANKEKYVRNMVTFPCIHLQSTGAAFDLLLVLSQKRWPPALRKTSITRTRLVMFTQNPHPWWPERRQRRLVNHPSDSGTQRAIFSYPLEDRLYKYLSAAFTVKCLREDTVFLPVAQWNKFSTNSYTLTPLNYNC